MKATFIRFSFFSIILFFSLFLIPFKSNSKCKIDDQSFIVAEKIQQSMDSIIWPKNWDGVPGNNPVLYCHDQYDVYWNGNPKTSLTGMPVWEGIDENLIEIFFTDYKYSSEPTNKILREWIVINDLTAEMYEHSQIIKFEGNPQQKLDACSIKFPKDTIVSCFEALLNTGPDFYWDEERCQNISIKLLTEDTIILEEGIGYKLTKEWAIIDWNTYIENTGAENNNDSIFNNTLNCLFLIEDGYYKFKQSAYIIDQVIGFDPCSITFPAAISTNCQDGLQVDQTPKWDLHPCTNVSFEIINEEIIDSTDSSNFTLLRHWAVIDWDIYEPNTNAEGNIDLIFNNKLDCSQLHFDGYYRYTQQIKMDENYRSFDPCTVHFPEKTITCAEEYFLNNEPSWQLETCQGVLAEIVKIDTTENIDGFRYKLKQHWVIIDWESYVANSGAEDNLDPIVDKHFDCANLIKDGYYKFEHTVYIEEVLSDTIIWPQHWDDSENNQPALVYNTGYEVDENNNPAPSLTGEPSGFNIHCNKKVVYFYRDRNFQAINGSKILRDWIVIHEYSGLISQFTQFILVIDEDVSTQKNIQNKKNFKLHQNFPNPFKSFTIIQFDLPSDQEYEISIYDINGRKLKDYSGKGISGSNQIKVLFEDIRSEGLLFYQLKSLGLSDFKRMLLFP